MLPSWIRSRRCKPRFTYFLATETTNRRLERTSLSSAWIVLSSTMRAPPSQARTMFWASWVCGPAAGPSGLAASRPKEPNGQAGAGRGV
jgi:hypothetical protein